MLKLIRLVLSIGSVLFLGALYAASQVAYFQGPEAAKDYALKADSPTIRLLAAVLFGAAVVLSFVRESEPGGEAS